MGLSDVGNETRAYAKLQGMDGLVYYMTDFRATFGRGPGVDLRVSSDLSISRVHARIEYCGEAQAFELHVLGKNGAFVNGVFARRGDAPLALQSQTEITFGKTSPVSLVFLLPCAEHARNVPQKPQARRPRSLAMVVGQILLASPKGRLNAAEIVFILRERHRDYADSIGELSVLESSVRNALTSNQQLFCVHPALDLETNVHDPDVMMLEDREFKATMPELYRRTHPRQTAAQFSVSPDHVVRFLGDKGRGMHQLESSPNSGRPA
jgi:hypothetical protein